MIESQGALIGNLLLERCDASVDFGRHDRSEPIGARAHGSPRHRGDAVAGWPHAKPDCAPIPYRVGGFGGIEGLRAFLQSERIDAVVDATHPFATQMSLHAEAACRAEGAPLAVFTRPAWARQPGDDWTEVECVEGAVAALGDAPRNVFLTQGRLQLGAFRVAPQHLYVVRAIDAPEEIAALPRHRLILARGPFRLEDELALMRDEAIDILVTKNSGGAATYPKIEAARRLGVKVVVLKRPKGGEAPRVVDLDAALAWIEAHRPAP